MKRIKYFLIRGFLLLAVFAPALQVNATHPGQPALAGDQFSLEGALELFKNANSLEEFERSLNSEQVYVNNLDLNEDGQLDYLKVTDYAEGNVHAIVIQALLSETQSQDVAVIEIEKNTAQSAFIQIVGDKDLYGEEMIVEPSRESLNTPYVQTSRAGSSHVIINVWAWPVVRYIYSPAYVVYRPSWRWGYYPHHWKPCRPYAFSRQVHYVRPYQAHYQVVHTHRMVHAHRIYKPYRNSAPVVTNRYHVNRVSTPSNRHSRPVHIHQNNHKSSQVKVVRTTERQASGSRGHRSSR